MRKKKAYPRFESDLQKLYPKSVVYGPYIRKQDGRAMCVLVTASGKKLTKLYAKFKLEIKLGRKLTRNDCVDHKDEDKTNDKFSNLQLLTRTDNAKKSHKTGNSKTTQLIAYGRRKDVRKKRSDRMLGDSNPLAGTTNSEVKKARVDFNKGKATLPDLVQRLQLTTISVRSLLEGKTYKTAGGPICVLPRRPAGKSKASSRS